MTRLPVVFDDPRLVQELATASAIVQTASAENGEDLAEESADNSTNQR